MRMLQPNSTSPHTPEVGPSVFFLAAAFKAFHLKRERGISSGFWEGQSVPSAAAPERLKSGACSLVNVVPVFPDSDTGPICTVWKTLTLTPDPNPQRGSESRINSLGASESVNPLRTILRL